MHEGHDHHHHEHGERHESEKSLALLTYMLEHNRHHAQELHELAHSLSDAGKADAASLLHESVACFEQGNGKLESALAALREAK